MKPFGRVLNRMMVDREMYEWKDLVSVMQSEGHAIESSKLSQYLYGGRHPRDPEEFFGVVARVLGLSEAEKKELMFAYGFPDSFVGSKVAEERGAALSDAEERLRMRAEGFAEDRDADGVGSGKGTSESSGEPEPRT